MRTLYLIVLVFLCVPFTTAVIDARYRHTNDYYAITYDGEGDAIVSAELTIRNSETRTINVLTLELPRRIVIYDVAQRCGYQFISLKQQDLHEEVLSGATALSIALSEGIEPDETCTILLSYKVERSAQKLINHHFDFETIIDNSASLIENVRVAVDVQPGLYLRGGRADVEYLPSYELAGFQQAAIGRSVADEAYPQYSRVIRQASGVVKSTTNLDAGESFHVTGTYGRSRLLLYAGTIFWWLCGGATVILVVLALLKRRRIHEHKRREQSEKVRPNSNRVLLSMGVGFAGAAGLIIMTVGGIMLLKMTGRMYYHDLAALVQILFILCIIVIDITILLGPALYLGKKYGVGSGFVCFAATVISLFVLAALLLIVAALIMPPRYAII